MWNILEIQTKYTIRHNTSMLYNNVLHVLVHQEHHHTSLWQKLQYILSLHSSTLCFQFLYVLTMWAGLAIIILFRLIPLCLLYMKYKQSILSNTTLQCSKTMCYMFWFIRTIIRYVYFKSLGTQVIKVPSDGSDEPQHVPHCCIALKCCVWLHSKHNMMNLNKTWSILFEKLVSPSVESVGDRCFISSFNLWIIL